MSQGIPLTPDQIPVTPTDLGEQVADAYHDTRDLIDLQLEFAAHIHDTPEYIDPLAATEYNEPIEYDDETLLDIHTTLRDTYADAPDTVTVDEQFDPDRSMLTLVGSRTYEFHDIPMEVVSVTEFGDYEPQQTIALFVDPQHDDLAEKFTKDELDATILNHPVRNAFPEDNFETRTVYAFTIVQLANKISRLSFFSRPEAESWVLSQLGRQPNYYPRRHINPGDFETAAEKLDDLHTLRTKVEYMSRLADQGLDGVYGV